MIVPTRHMREQIEKRFQETLKVTPEQVVEVVNTTLNPEDLSPEGQTWVRLLKLENEITLPAPRARDKAVNGDELIAVVRWNRKHEDYRIVTVMLRRSGWVDEDATFWDASHLTSVTV